MSAITIRKIHSLRKAEIIKGTNSCDKSFRKSKSISLNYIKFYFNEVGYPGNSNSTADNINKIMVGFIVSKKKLKKAVLRVKAKRLLRETYRLGKNNIHNLFRNSNLTIILTYSDKGYKLLNKNAFPKRQILDSELVSILAEIKKQNFN